MLRFKHLIRNSSCILVISVIILILTAAFFATARNIIEPKRWPDMKLEDLRHPLYVTNESADLESFMQFAGYTNIERKNAEGEWVPSYDPKTDLTGAGSLMPT